MELNLDAVFEIGRPQRQRRDCCPQKSYCPISVRGGWRQWVRYWRIERT